MSNELKVKNGLIVQGPMWATFAYTTASWAVNTLTASLANNATSASHADLADAATNATNALYASSSLNATNATYASSSTSASYASASTSASYALVSTNADSASYLSGAFAIVSQLTASTADITDIYGTLHGSLDGTASWATNAVSATSASYASASTSASYAVSASNLIGWNFNNTGSVISATATPTPVIAISTGSYLAAFFDYAITNGSNIRAGTIFGSWLGGSVTYSEVSNVDVGDTNEVTLSLVLNGSNVQLTGEASTTAPWTVKALGRYI